MLSEKSTVQSQQMLQSAYREYSSGNLLNSKDILKNILKDYPRNSSALHLLAIVEKAMGAYNNALIIFDKALNISPHDAEILANKANLLSAMQNISSIGVYSEAIALQPSNFEFRLNRAITYLHFGDPPSAMEDVEYLSSHMPHSAKFWTVAGQAFLANGERARAKIAFKKALQLEPNRVAALAGIGGILLNEGDEAASGYLGQALQLRPSAKELSISYVEALETEGRTEVAVSVLTELVKRDLGWVEGHKVLARMRWEAGERDFTGLLEHRITNQKDDVDLRIALIETLSMAHLFDQALEVARQLRNDFAERQDYRLLEAKLARLCGHFEEAIALHGLIADDLPGKAFEAAQLWIRLTDFERAQSLLDVARIENEDVEFWAVQGVLWRLTNAAKSRWLHPEEFVQIYSLDLSIDELKTIAETLRGFHKARKHPIGQSMRRGTQTRGALFERNHEHVVMLHSAISKAVNSYWLTLPAYDDQHPLLRHRNGQLDFSGSWSVRLHGEGFHIPHIHPHGVLSSACYIALPPAQPDAAGYLELGRAPVDLGLNIGPIKVIEPIVGNLALFPSTLYHGTVPFAEGERLSVAFDLVTKNA